MFILRRSLSSSSSSSSSAASTFEHLAAKTTSPHAKAELSKLQGLYTKVQTEAKLLSDNPAPIDFNGYKSKVRNVGVVNEIEQALKAVQYPVGENTTAGKAEAKLQELVGQAKASSEASGKRASELKEFLNRLQANRTTVDTTVDDVAKLYPQLEKEIEEETANQQWGKGLGAGV
jgi:hypothetical protein